MSDKTEAIVVASPQDVQHESWGGAAARGLQARIERERIIEQVLKPGVDYMVIPGTKKPTLVKPGAEKINDCLRLYPDYQQLKVVEDWDRPLFHYQYRCVLRERGSETIVATGIGSCNSMESKYRWRQSERVCPSCGTNSIIKGKREYGGGWLCYAKKGGCGAKFPTGAKEIEGQEVGRIENDDVYSQVNTIDKMAQKRALIAADLNLGFSEQFTQDLDDLPLPGSGHEPVAIAPQRRTVIEEAEALDAEYEHMMEQDDLPPPPEGEEPDHISSIETRRIDIMNKLIGNSRRPFKSNISKAKAWVFKIAGADIMQLSEAQCYLVEQAIADKLYENA